MTDVSSIYKKELEQEIIALLAQKKSMSLDDAMDAYYGSRLAQQISDGTYGIEYLSPAYLVDDLIENEAERFTL